MDRSTTMQAVFSQFMANYQQHHRLTPAQTKVCRHIGMCRTAALGGQVVHCDHCPFEQVRYHSCRNRHCPQCQRRASLDWGDKQCRQVLPVPYFHLVFTLPHTLNPWLQLHPEVLYSCLFRAVWKTLKQFGADKKRLDGELGMTAVLHTWGQNLSQHVHLHCIVPGGALSAAGWHPSKGSYLFPVRALSRHFRGAMVSAIRNAAKRGKLHRINDPKQVDERLSQLMSHDWVVYSRSRIEHTESVVNYLARYSHKIAISDSRILDIGGEGVTFGWKDYRDSEKNKRMTLSGDEFIRRFLLHVLPPGLMRIRHYGFLANRCREAKLKVIRDGLKLLKTTEEKPKVESVRLTAAPTAPLCPCPKCKQGLLRVISEIPRPPWEHKKRRQLH